MGQSLVWNASLETGVRQIDLQHQELVELIGELETAHDNQQHFLALGQVLPRLTAYAAFHFGTEESLLVRVVAGTPHAVQHLEQHRHFAETVQLMQAQHATDPAHTVAQLLDYLKTWLVAHIQHTDKELARHILARRN